MSTVKNSYRFKYAKHALDAQSALRKMASLKVNPRKMASLGGDQEGQFEQSFASLAFAYLKDKAPKLLDFMLGFQLVDRNDDNTKAIGIFGFKVGKEFVYAPVFFLNGDLKGHELLYLKGQDQFVPMKENWVNYLLNRQPHHLGEGTDEQAQQLNVRQPYYGSFNFPPGKMASYAMDVPPPLREYIKEAMPLLGAAAVKSPALMSKFAGLDDRLSFRRWLAESVDNVKSAKAIFDQYPLLKQAAETFHGESILRDSLLDLRKKALAQVNDPILGETATALSKVAENILGMPVKAAAGPDVTIKFNEDDLQTNNIEDHDEADKEKMLRDGMLVEDNRTGEEVSKVYNVQQEMKLQNPNETGLYDVLVKGGKFKRCLIVVGPCSGEGNQEFVTIVDTESKAWLNTHIANVFVREQESKEDYRKYLEGLGKAESFETGGHYLVLTQRGTGSTPFEVDKKVEDDDGTYKVYFRDHCNSHKSNYKHPTGYAYSVTGIAPWESGGPRVYLNKRKGSKLTAVNGSLFVPPESYKLTLKDPPKPKDDDHGILGSCGCGGRVDSSDPAPLQPGNIVDLQMEIMQKTARLKVINDGTEVMLNNGPRLTKRAAFCELILKHGLREAVAKEVLKTAEHHNGATFRIKYAEPYATMQGPGAPGIPDQQFGYDATSGGAAQYPQEDFMPVPDMQGGPPRSGGGGGDNGMMQPDPQAMQAAQQAGQSGQKEVFDVSMIGGMLKSVREDSLVDRYLGDLLKALDRLGRILFLFYWHSEEFQDRYGKADMPELEDSLRNAFEAVGDITLYLKQKQIEPFAGAEKGEPEIQETARN